MSEPKQQNWFIPLKVRYRSPAEQTQSERYQSTRPLSGEDSAQTGYPSEMSAAEALLRARQTKELIRLAHVLRADLSLNEILQQIVASISSCTGFRILVVHLLDDETNLLSAVAFAGMSEDNERLMREVRRPVEAVLRLMRPEFRTSQSYFISHEYSSDFSDLVSVVHKTVNDYEPGGWHPEDALIVPLFSPRQKKLLGFLSLDDPEDGKLPTEEGIEVAELFANQAAIAIDNARIFEEKEAERLALEEGIAQLRADLESIQRGDLRVRIRSTHEKLQPIGEAINSMVAEMSSILGNVQMVTHAVDEHTREVQQSSEVLLRDASQQERQVRHISHVVDEIAVTMRLVSEHAEKLSRVAVEAMDATTDGQATVDRAVEGMGQVRDATMHSARIMKRLGESSQEINETVLFITDLTTRMNLLALNAAIEAARAGDQNSGSSVIAQEIRALALNSADAARKVAAHIRTIQYETTAVAKSIEQNIQQGVRQTELVMHTGDALEGISIVTEQMADLVQGISAAADNQSQGSQLVVGVIEEISRMTVDITEHVRQMQQSLSYLVELTNSLRSRLSVFRIGER